MDKFLNAISAVLDAIGTVLMVVIIIGGTLLGGCLAWFILGVMEVSLWACIGGTLAAGFVSGFLSWVFINIAAFINLD